MDFKKLFLRCVHDVRHLPTLYFFTQSVEIFYNYYGFSALFGQTDDFDAFPLKLVCDHTLSLNPSRDPLDFGNFPNGPALRFLPPNLERLPLST